ncbi:MAG: alpha-E domain-containing protein [Thermaerobacterales bacterium]
MLNRIADSLFWLGRYTERAENLARAVDVHYHYLLEINDGEGERAAVQAAWWLVSALSGVEEVYATMQAQPATDEMLRLLVTDSSNPNAILACVGRARENASAVREHISSEMWEELNKFYLQLLDMSLGEADVQTSPYDWFYEIKTRLQLFQGVTDATMLRGENWEFVQAGKFLERGDQTARLMRARYRALLEGPADAGEAVSFHQWMALLKSCSGYEAYRWVYRRVTPERVAELLLLNDQFPRSVRFCCRRLQAALRSIARAGRSDAQPAPGPGAAACAGVMEILNIADINVIWPQGMQECLDNVIDGFAAVDLAIFQEYFAA